MCSRLSASSRSSETSSGRSLTTWIQLGVPMSSRQKKKHKQRLGIVPGMGGGQIFHRETNGRFRKSIPAEHANVPSFRFLFRGNIGMYPRSGFRSSGTSAKTILLENHPFANSRLFMCCRFFGAQRETHKQNYQAISGKCRDCPGTIPK